MMIMSSANWAMALNKAERQTPKSWDKGFDIVIINYVTVIQFIPHTKYVQVIALSKSLILELQQIWEWALTIFQRSSSWTQGN